MTRSVRRPVGLRLWQVVGYLKHVEDGRMSKHQGDDCRSRGGSMVVRGADAGSTPARLRSFWPLVAARSRGTHKRHFGSEAVRVSVVDRRHGQPPPVTSASTEPTLRSSCQLCVLHTRDGRTPSPLRGKSKEIPRITMRSTVLVVGLYRWRECFTCFGL